MGQIAAIAVFGSLVLVVVGAFVLAILHHPVDEIRGILEALQPFLLPAIAAIVGYAIGRRVSGADG